jgi:hypothetical protein
MPKSNRRKFLQTTVAAATASALPRFAIGKPGESSNSKINMAVVGCGGMGNYAMGEAMKQNLVAMCDLDEIRAAKNFKKNEGVKIFKDFRVMLDKMGDEIDAVAISTPDHTHFAAAMAAMERGKHVFIQKPLAHNIWQVRTLQKAAKKYGVKTQMGNQGHTFEGMRRIKEWIDAGIIGDVSEVITWTNRPNVPWFVPPAKFPPGGLRATEDARLGPVAVADRGAPPTANITPRRPGAAGGTTTAARSATSAATPSTPRSGCSTSAYRPRSKSSARIRPARASSRWARSSPTTSRRAVTNRQSS